MKPRVAVLEDHDEWGHVIAVAICRHIGCGWRTGWRRDVDQVRLDADEHETGHDETERSVAG